MYHKIWTCVCGETWQAHVPSGVRNLIDREWERIHNHKGSKVITLNGEDSSYISRWLEEGGSPLGDE